MKSINLSTVCKRMVRKRVSIALPSVALLLLSIAFSQKVVGVNVELVHDINAESAISAVNTTTKFVSNGRLAYFLHKYTGWPTRLWFTDGKRARIVDLSPLRDDPERVLVVSDKHVFFTAIEPNSEDLSFDIYRVPVNRTNVRPELLLDDVVYSRVLKTANGRLFLRVATSSGEDQLFVIDEGRELRPVNGIPDINFSKIHAIGNRLFVTVKKSSERNSRLLVLEPDADRLVPVRNFAKNITDGDHYSTGDQAGAASTLFYFLIRNKNAGDDIASCSIWRSNGTSSGTFPVASIRLQSDLILGCPHRIYAQKKNRIYFLRRNSVGANELWTTDGTTASTALVSTEPTIEEVAVSTDRLWFVSKKGNATMPWDPIKGDRSVWRSNLDGSNTTRYHRTVNRRILDLTAAGNRVFFYESEFGGPKTLYIGDNQSTSAQSVQMFRFVGEYEVPIRQFAKPLGTRILTYAGNGNRGLDLISVDTRSRKVTTISRFGGVTGGSETDGNIVVRNGEAYFCATTHKLSPTGFVPLELWKSNGTSRGTIPLIGNLRSIHNSRPWCGDFAVGDRFIYFTRKTEGHGWELMRSDRNGRNSRLFADLIPGPGSSGPTNIERLNDGRLIITARAKTPQGVFRKLFVGTPEGSWKSLNPALEKPRFVVSNGRRVVVFDTYKDRRRLLVTDGTGGGTVVLSRGQYARDTQVVGEDIYLHLRSDTQSKIVKLGAGQTRLKLIRDLSQDFSSEELSDYRLKFLLAHDNAIYMLRWILNRGQVWRLNLADDTWQLVWGGENSSVFDTVLFDGNLIMTVIGNRDSGDYGWRILRYDLLEGTAVVAHEERFDRRHGDRYRDQPPGELQGDDNALWFFAPAFRKGRELWRITSQR